LMGLSPISWVFLAAKSTPGFGIKGTIHGYEPPTSEGSKSVTNKRQSPKILKGVF